MAPNIGSVFNKFLSLFVLLLHLGCFIFTSKLKDHHPNRPPPIKKRKKVSPLAPISSSPSRLKPHKALSSSWSYLKSIFSSKSSKTQTKSGTQTLTSARSSQQSIVTMIPPETHLSELPPRKNSTCGEIFQKPQLLEQHQAAKHAVTQLLDVQRYCQDLKSTGSLSKPKLQETVRERDERCIADGNELLRFYCSTFMCDLGLNDQDSSICNQQYCSVCGVIKSGFSPKMDGISTLSTSWRAHTAIPEEIEEEFKFMNVKRAMLVCRVVAGRVGCELDEDVDKQDGGADSVLGRGGSGVHTRLDEQELLVFNPRAVLPCFVIVYTV
ncbi:hypothetical protein OIU84_008690 [Salix udensis]|uniref:C2H2-type domain-containing protein n=1 Tax=Salix udensis TaxID=889485 RepID=A0AAD6NY19_9ROSI|nr:hypothetical protein OIU84_008690 [Salix udensis]